MLRNCVKYGLKIEFHDCELKKEKETTLWFIIRLFRNRNNDIQQVKEIFAYHFVVPMWYHFTHFVTRSQSHNSIPSCDKIAEEWLV